MLLATPPPPEGALVEDAGGGAGVELLVLFVVFVVLPALATVFSVGAAVGAGVGVWVGAGVGAGVRAINSETWKPASLPLAQALAVEVASEGHVVVSDRGELIAGVPLQSLDV